MEVRCRHCSVKLKVPGELAGRKVKCPGCGQVFRIPEDAAQAAEVICAGCGGSIAVHELRRESEGKLYCSACMAHPDRLPRT